MAVEMDPRQKRNRTRSPAYPFIALPAALEKAAVLWQVEGRHAAAVSVALQHWGYKEDSSTGYSCVAALKKFGLVDHEGMGDQRQVRLSGLALSILLDKNPDSPERRDALRAAALGPRIHAELWERYGTELPSDQSLKRFLVIERAFNEAAVGELLDEYKVTMAFAGLPVGTGAGTDAPARPPLATTPLPATLPPAALSAPSSVRANAEPAVAPSGQGYNGQDRRQEAPPGTSRASARPSTTASGTSNAPTVSGVGPRPTAAPNGPGVAQWHLFDEEEPAGGAEGGFGGYEETLVPAVRPRDAAVREGGSGPWSMARRELPVPLDNDLVARVPYPMTEEDFRLLIDTLQLWKKRLVHPSR